MKQHPDFTISMYATAEHLHKAKAEYYQQECERLEGIIQDIAQHTVCDDCYAWKKAMEAFTAHPLQSAQGERI